jgi:hypothetical protein
MSWAAISIICAAIFFGLLDDAPGADMDSGSADRHRGLDGHQSAVVGIVVNRKPIRIVLAA